MNSQTKSRQILALLNKVTYLINAKQYHPPSNVHLNMVVLALLSKSMIVGKSVCTLVQSGFHAEAFGLTRTLVDIYFTIRYLTNRDCEARAKRFVNFFAKDHAGWTEIVRKYYPTTTFTMPGHHTQMMEIAKDYRNPHKWTGLGDQIKQMTLEEDTHEHDGSGNPLRCEFDYEVVYKWTSHYVHPTVVALDAHAVERDEPFVIHARKEQDTRFESLALFNVVTYVNKILICSFRCLGTEFPTDLSKDFDTAMRSL